jgi:hypothetical protein
MTGYVSSSARSRCFFSFILASNQPALRLLSSRIIEQKTFLNNLINPILAGQGQRWSSFLSSPMAKKKVRSVACIHIPFIIIIIIIIYYIYYSLYYSPHLLQSSPIVFTKEENESKRLNRPAPDPQNDLPTMHQPCQWSWTNPQPGPPLCRAGWDQQWSG